MEFLFPLGLALFILALLYWQKRQAREGKSIGYNETLGISTPYDIAKDAAAVQAGKKQFKPTASTYLVPAVLLLALGSIGFIPPISGTMFAIGIFFWFLGILLLVAAFWAHRGAKPSKNKPLLYTGAFLFLAVVIGFILFIEFPGIMKGEGTGGLVVFLAFAVGGSFYSYFVGRKSGQDINSK